MEFRQFNELMKSHVKSMTEEKKYLFEVELDKDKLWDTYLDSFPAGMNELFRKRREFDCSCCRHFVKNFGNVVSIKDGQIITIWDFETNDDKYQPVINALAAHVKSFPITEVFVTDTRTFGVEKTVEDSDNGVFTWNHFNAQLSKSVQIFDKGDIGKKRGELRDTRNVFKRSLDELTIESVDTLLELIAQNSLYKGEEWEAVLKQFVKLKKEYNKTGNKELYCWEKSVEVGAVVGRIRNHSIGVLLTNLSEDMDLDEALRKYEAIVAPSNYKRPKAIFTKKMVEEAQWKILEMGLSDSLERRYANIDDITVNNILFANRDAKKKMLGDVFDDLAGDVSTKKVQNFDKLEEIPVDKFIADILPKVTSMELLLENKHAGNMVSLIAPKNKDSKSMFKWNNNFAWAYAGNMTDSMKERVKAAGGRVDGVLRFSIQWNDDGKDGNDLDAHCIEPDGQHIFFNNKLSFRTGGNLDVDIRHPDGKIAVENITWPKKSNMKFGQYTFSVHNFAHRGGRNGFSAEIEFDGKIYSFVHNKDVRQNESVEVAKVMLNKNGEFSIEETLKSTVSSCEVWGIKTNQFHPVSVAMYSPNYWDDQNGIGHRHYMFMLKDCKNTESPNGFFNEFLREEFMEQKRVFEALGAKMKVEDADEQLSGVGFSTTKRNSFVCKVEGTFKRMLRVVI